MHPPTVHGRPHPNWPERPFLLRAQAARCKSTPNRTSRIFYDASDGQRFETSPEPSHVRRQLPGAAHKIRQ